MLKWRLITAGVLIPLVILGLFYLPIVLLKIILTGLLLGCAYEYVKLAQVTAQQAWGWMAGVGVLFLTFTFIPLFQSLSMKMVALGFIFWCFSFALLVMFSKSTTKHIFGWGSVYGKALIGIGMLLPCFIGMALLILKGPIWLLAGLSIVWAADSGAYFAGRFKGKTLLASTISPKKTWEGVAGGVVAALVIAILFYCLSTDIKTLSLLKWLPLTIGVVIFSVAGDLFESMIKRVSGVKDSGAILPGHGGLLDRLDGVFAALPLYCLGVIA